MYAFLDSNVRAYTCGCLLNKGLYSQVVCTSTIENFYKYIQVQVLTANFNCYCEILSQRAVVKIKIFMSRDRQTVCITGFIKIVFELFLSIKTVICFLVLY